MTGYLPVVYMATTSVAIVFLTLSLGSHRHNIDDLHDDLDRAHQEIDVAHQRIDWLAGYPNPQPATPREPNPAPTQPIREKGRHRQ